MKSMSITAYFMSNICSMRTTLTLHSYMWVWGMGGCESDFGNSHPPTPPDCCLQGGATAAGGKGRLALCCWSDD